MLKAIILALFVGVFLANLDTVNSRRGGGGGRRYSWRSSRYRAPSRPTVRKPPKVKITPGFKTLGKIALATYVAKRMKPKVHFKHFGDRYDKPEHCFSCLSVNGSDILCERGDAFISLSTQRCLTSHLHGYCATEYGITSDNKPYVRRSCNEQLCSTCSSHLTQAAGNITKTCYVIECQLCNQNGCNKDHISRAFPEKRQTMAGDGGGGSSLKSNLFLATTTVMFLAGSYMWDCI